MAHLGSFGAARAEANASAELDTFEFLGEEFRVAATAGGAARMIDLAESAVASGADTESLASIVMLKESARQLIFKDDWARFWAKFTEKEGTGESLAELTMTLAKHVAERATGRPTQPPSGSSAGSPATATGSGSSGPSFPLPSVPPSSELANQPMVLVPDGNGGYTASVAGSPATSPTP